MGKSHKSEANKETTRKKADQKSDKLEELEAQVANLKDQLLRAMAETENVRKRVEREREEAAKYAITGLARELTNVADNLGRALESVSKEGVEENESFKTFLEGVEMTEKELLATFARHGIKKIEPLGEKFSHEHHQAMFELEHDEFEEGHVAELMQSGYLIHDRLLRPALVGVSKGKKKKE